MYRFEEKQLSFTDFNQPQGLQMNPENRWVKKAEICKTVSEQDRYASKAVAYGTRLAADPETVPLSG